MSDTLERVAVACPACSPGAETVHEVLKDGGNVLTVSCTECGHTHKAEVEQERTEQLDVVVSQDGESFTTQVDAPADEELAVGEEFIVDTEEALMTVRITAIEVGQDQRRGRAPIPEVQTVWTRVVDNVTVPITINPSGGRRDETRSIDLLLPGDEEFTVGETRAFGEEKFTVKHIHIREDAFDHGYDHAKLDYRGDSAFAKDIKRLYADDESSSAWSAW